MTTPGTDTACSLPPAPLNYGRIVRDRRQKVAENPLFVAS